jgi:cobalt/nickel transport system permease protein
LSRSGLLDSILKSLSRALSHALISEHTARQSGAMQSLDPRVRLAGVFVLVIAVALVHKIAIILALLGGAVVLALLSAITPRTLALRVWLVVLAFTGVIALPALFLTPGDPLSALSPITSQGLHTAVMLIARVEAAATLTTTLVLTTPWPQVLKALRSLFVPKEVVMMLAMAHRYIFLLAETATQMFESRESRRVGVLHRREQRRLVAQTAGVLMSKSIDLSQEVFIAMQSRGYRGDVQVLSERRIKLRDGLALGAFVIIAALSIWVGW